MSWLFWLVYFPLIRILALILYPLKVVRARISFEHKNRNAPECRSFATDGVKADLCFEFSSEGEYQQAASLIQDYLAQGLRIEVVFFSPSVEKAMIDLASKHPHQIRILRYPLVTISPKNSFSGWITASQLVLVRYDLFPEFLVWSQRPGHELKLLWVSFKKERGQGKFPSLYKRLFYGKAKKVFFASEAESSTAWKFGLSGVVYDFRIGQIHRRIASRSEKFASDFTLYPKLSQRMSVFPRDKRLIMGNGWVVDLSLLKNLPSDVFCLIVPHKLDRENLDLMAKELSGQGLSHQEITSETKDLEDKRVYILNRKGLLCELYQDFGKAYVGGGFGVSVHSLLEPLVAGSEEIACGPVHHRSTEFDLAENYGNLKEVRDIHEFQSWLLASIRPKDRAPLEKIIQQYPQMKQEVFHD